MNANEIQRFTEIYKRYVKLMLKIAYDILRDWHLAEDASQEVFIRVSSNMEKINGIDSPRTRRFLVVICQNVAITIFNTRKAQGESIELGTMQGDIAHESIEDSTIESLYIDEKLSSLSPEYKQVLLLYVDGFNTTEIAEVLCLPKETVKKRLQRARKALKIILEEEVS